MLLLASIFLVSACASSEKNSTPEEDYSNLVSLNPPGDQKQEESNLYIDTANVITYNNQRALLISGSFPDACTHLKAASDTLVNDTLEINLEVWRETNKMCAQVLTSFSYVYEGIPGEVLNNRSAVRINKRIYSIK